MRCLVRHREKKGLLCLPFSTRNLKDMSEFLSLHKKTFDDKNSAREEKKSCSERRKKGDKNRIYNILSACIFQKEFDWNILFWMLQRSSLNEMWGHEK